MTWLEFINHLHRFYYLVLLFSFSLGCVEQNSDQTISSSFKEADRQRSERIIRETIQSQLGKKGELNQADLNSVEKLNLSGRNLTDITYVAQLRNLREIGLNYNQLKNLKPLYSLKHLKLVEAAANPLPQEQITQFKLALPDCKLVTQ
tara:strand:+ start:156 stop:599 length:444 start_codon:yes stop_codon:yes gene_type:complete